MLKAILYLIFWPFILLAKLCDNQDNKTKQGGSYSPAQQRAINNCRRDLEAAMDDGCMEELEDIVQEQLGSGWSVDDLI